MSSQSLVAQRNYEEAKEFPKRYLCATLRISQRSEHSYF